MARPGNQPRCEACADKLVKNGATSAGRTRWRCRRCAASKTHWLLNSLTEEPHDPWEPARGRLQRRRNLPPSPEIDEPIGPARYDTADTADEGLWARSGWMKNR